MAHFLSAADIDGFLRATRAAAAAVASAGLIGSGDMIGVDRVAVEAMRHALNDLAVDGLVVVGEGEKDEAPMLHLGERFGRGTDGASGAVAVDIAVDPVDGTRLAAENRPGSLAVIAVAPRGAFFDIGPAHYMEKLVTSSVGAGLSLSHPLDENIGRLAAASGKERSELVVSVQDRPRNRSLATAVVASGARVDLFADGDVERCLRAASPDSGIDLVLGVGGAPEGVLTAAAVSALGGWMEGRLAPQRRREAARVVAAGLSTERILGLPELCTEESWLFLSAITACRVDRGTVLPAAQQVDGGVTVASWYVGAGGDAVVVEAVEG